MDLLSKSNGHLRQLMKDLEAFKVSKEDLRFDLWAMVTDILRNNIELRLWVNQEIYN